MAAWLGPWDEPGPAAMLAFVLGWLSALTAILTGVFLLMVAVSLLRRDRCHAAAHVRPP